MARLPNPGSDDGTWGDVLNDFLVQVHTSQGLLKDNSVGTPQLQNSSVSDTKLAANSVTGTAIADGVVSQAKLDSSVQTTLSNVGAKVLLIDTVGDLPPGTPADVVVVVKS